ncbi:MAG: hypothetical protein PHU58_00700 [Prevotella sp.]|nr:hypothetical protein [Prevotella sp.]
MSPKITVEPTDGCSIAGECKIDGNGNLTNATPQIKITLRLG